MRRVRVLWLVKGLALGGAERLLLEFARRSDHGRFEFFVAYIATGRDAMVEELRQAGVVVVDLSGSPSGLVRRVWRVIALVRDGKFDVVHAHSPVLAAVSRLAIASMDRRHRPTPITTEHNMWSAYRWLTRIANALTYRWSGQVFAVSNAVAMSVAPMWRPKVAVLHHGVDLEAVQECAAHRSEVRRELGITNDVTVVGVVANLRLEKDVPLMLRVASRCLAELDDILFIHVGGGSLEESIRVLHNQLSLGSAYQLLGSRADARRLMSGFDLIAFSSRQEGLPVAAMEAFALGLPIVTTAAGGLANLVTDGLTGFVVPVGDEIGLAAGIQRLASDRELRLRMSVAAVGRSRDFDIGHAVCQLESVYSGSVT